MSCVQEFSLARDLLSLPPLTMMHSLILINWRFEITLDLINIYMCMLIFTHKNYCDFALIRKTSNKGSFEGNQLVIA